MSERQSEKSGPLVTAIMAAYNGEKYIEQAVESVFAQTYPNIELIVVDDGSTDSTPEILKSYGGTLTYVWQENQGGAAARNLAISHARGEFVANLDHDDVWLPEKTAKQVETFLAAPELDVVFGLAETMDAQGNTMEVAAVAPRGWHPRALGLPFAAYVCDGDVLARLIEGNVVSHSTVMMRRESVLKAGAYEPCRWPSDDYDLWLRLAARGCNFGLVGSILYRYRQHGNQITRDVESHHHAHMQVLEDVFAGDGYPPKVRDAARRAFGGKAKVLGDHAFAAGDTKKARAYYRQAMRYWPRPIQRLSWALTLLGSIGLRGARLLNRGSDIFTDKRAAAYFCREALGKR